MKKLIATIFFAFMFTASNAQQINSKIHELYGDKTLQIAQNDPERIKALTNLLDNRVQVVESPVNAKEVYPKLSEMGLLNKYNPDLKRDLVFDPNNFNPLKYDLSFFSKKTEAYRVDNTDYIIVIQPQTFK